MANIYKATHTTLAPMDLHSRRSASTQAPLHQRHSGAYKPLKP